jgi:hypothetical protein
VNLREISVSEGTLHFKISGDFLLNFEGLSIKLYFGSGGTITIPNTIERVEAGCFCAIHTISNVIFETGSRLCSIGEAAFTWCTSLSSIYIPSSVETLGKECFSKCGSLSTVTFESGSKLSSIDESTFYHCSSLSSI